VIQGVKYVATGALIFMLCIALLTVPGWIARLFVGDGGTAAEIGFVFWGGTFLLSLVGYMWYQLGATFHSPKGGGGAAE
jgi:hypothetical protein